MSKKTKTGVPKEDSSLENNYYYFEANNLICKGHFELLQVSSGAIHLKLGNNEIPLSYPQTQLLPSNLYDLVNFNQEKFNEYYLKNL